MPGTVDRVNFTASEPLRRRRDHTTANRSSNSGVSWQAASARATGYFGCSNDRAVPDVAEAPSKDRLWIL